MIDASLVDILRCPESGQRVILAPIGLVQHLESLRLKGTLRNVCNTLVQETIQAGLVRQDGARFFLIRDNIPVMLSEESIEIPQ